MSRSKTAQFFVSLSFVWLLLAIQSNVSAQAKQTGVIEGRILSADRHPEENVIVVLTPSSRQVMSDDNGHFEFRNVPYGQYTISIKSLGVTAEPVPVELYAAKASAGTIRLNENASTLDRVIVSSSYRHINKNSTQVARMPLTYTENPQNYAVIPKEVLQNQLVTTTEQALVNIPGASNLSIVGGSGGSSLTFMSRGFSSGSVMYRNSVSTGYVALTDMFNVERIEAIKGPSGTLFGGNEAASYGGVYNLITKQPLEVKRGEISFTTGSYELARATLDYNTPLNEDKTALLRFNGFYDNRNTFQQLAQNNVGFAPSLLVKATDRLTLHFDGYYYKSIRPIVLFGFGAPPGGTTETSTYAGNVKDLGIDPSNSYINPDFNSSQQTWSATGKAEYKLSEQWLSQTNFSVARNNNVTHYINLVANKKTATDTAVITRNILEIPFSQLYTQQFQQNFIGDFKIGSLRNRLLAGLDYFRTNVGQARGTVIYDKIYATATETQKLIKKARVDSIGANIAYNATRSIANSYGAYASEVLNITDQLLLMASLRINRFVDVNNDYMQTSYSPKLGLSYEIVKNILSVYSNYNNGYRNNSNLDSSGNLLKPTYANQWEAGVKFDAFHHRLTGTVSYYDIKVKNMPLAVPNTTYYIQDNKQRSRGIDVDILANPVPGLNIAMGYGYNNIRYTEFTAIINKAPVVLNGNRVEGTPHHAGNIWANYGFTSGSLKGFGFGAGGNGQSSSFTNNVNTITLDGFTVFGASVFYDAPKFRLTAKIDNIANKKYYTYSSWLLPGATRMLAFNATFRF
ncbi:TonB-dependent receptor domain-containing protein [Niabella drilacis]|uniref:Iron complex outermembrane recepter protein n=1 Tax=Niabella drilacis (strain DSM 25811 / CCM 8410 / CCUG 62505 / LMG 26954 / E90) TaxID=1285928 RepID=A0A1G6PKW3_NIADE|nr:TonB-dependent receptor [Niabella drilacis]SDC80679.1 iron complex outermembrane recepter protein [Niabella drilacis]